MLRKLKILPVLIIVFLLSCTALVTLERYVTKIDIKQQVIRVKTEIKAGQPIDLKSVEKQTISIDWLSGVKYVKMIEELEGMYAKETLYPGDIIRVERIGKKNDILLSQVKQGFERIAVKVKRPDNAVSYQILTGEEVALRCTIDSRDAKDLGLVTSIDPQRSYLPDTVFSNTITNISIFEKRNLLAVCDRYGNVIPDETRLKNSNEKVDSFVFDVTHDEAMLIQKLREKGNFEITKITSN